MFQWEVFGEDDPPLWLHGLDMLYRHIDLFSPSLPNSGSAFTLGRACSTLSVDPQGSGLDKQHADLPYMYTFH